MPSQHLGHSEPWAFRYRSSLGCEGLAYGSATHENHYKDHSEDGEFGRARVARLGCHHLVDEAEAQSAHHRNRERQERPEGRGPHRQRQQIRTDCLSIERGCGRAVQDRSQGRQAAGDPQVIRLTRDTEIPQSRAASGLPAAARICLPIDVNSR